MQSPQKYARRFLALAFGTLCLAGCSTEGGVSFSSRSSELGESLQKGLTEIRLTKSRVIVSAPVGYCFDRDALDVGTDGGFAILARGDALQGPQRHSLPFWKRLPEAAIITATISGPLTKADTPDVQTLAASVRPNAVLARHPDALMPMVRVTLDSPAVDGTSPTHWRGAFALQNRLVSLALYAPDDSSLLGASGVLLLRDMAHRSTKRSGDILTLDRPGAPLRPPPSRPNDSTAELKQTVTVPTPGRPRARPGSTPTVAQAPRQEKLSLKQRIAGLFN